ncbi:DNA repair protein, RAD5 [Polychaeton citri CBS 116435]|uniref:DNA repair protein, RAD5 n=1 Tax=Polychaeton citri CBS 116435 TaxID=1314669 RepID=A0A9P4USI9_9PEZI|nr:DNA repair protein, RAD5 [Polychaeton citri CBS 116435]
MTDIDLRPHKRRRFFVEDSPEPQNTTFEAEDTPHHESSTSLEKHESPVDVTQTQTVEPSSFDIGTFKAFVGGEVPDEAVQALRRICGKDVERAVNTWFDGSWRQDVDRRSIASPPTLSKHQGSGSVTSQANRALSPAPTPARVNVSPKQMPRQRYIGALGVAGWATKSGVHLLKPGDKVQIERTKQQTLLKKGRGGKVQAPQRKTQDFIVRFTNARGEEIGRLEKDSAAWISTLIDQQVCTFEGTCVFADERIRTNDTIYLQLRCYMLRSAFGSGKVIKPLDDNRQTGLFEARETNEERDLRLRQIGLVKLFSEINLHPSKVNETTAKHKREGILQAAEIAEQYESDDARKKARSGGSEGTPRQDGGSSPPSEEVEEGEKLEQDQLDSLYKKAQTFDFNTPEAQPASTFAMDLRKYQKQALHWMISKERSTKVEDREQSMHPLWEEYLWPTKDVDGADLPTANEQDAFYVNPYSGELSADFPVQEQNCEGGILADEMGLGKTIEMLSLVHSNMSPEQKAAIEETSRNRADATAALPRLPKKSNNVESAPATTLVVAPMSLLSQWASEAEKASKDGTLRVLVYYGSDSKSVNLQTLCCASNSASAPNVIITSYGVVLSEYNNVAIQGGNRGSHGGLFSLDYWRIILDEAHMIKNRQSKTAKACCELAATHRWVLTGTPIVNRLEDFFSLVRFLRVEPWSNFSFWKTFITMPFEKGDFVRALDVVQTVLEPLVLRRTKDMKTPEGEALVPLPPKTIDIERVKLSEPEREVYNLVYARAKRTFAQNVEAGTVMKSYTTIFAQILRLRQSCCHPLLTRNKSMVVEEEEVAAAADIVNGLADDIDLQALMERFEADSAEGGGIGEQDASKFGAHVLKQIQDEAEIECPICSEEPMIEPAVVAGCWHSACKKCLLDYIELQISKGELPRCFNCREPIYKRDVFEVIKHDDDDDDVDENVEAAELVGDDSAALARAIDIDNDTDAENLYTSSQVIPDSAAAKPEKKQRSKAPPHIILRRTTQLSSAKISALLTHVKRLHRKKKSSSGLPQKSVIFSQFTSFLDLLGPALTASSVTHVRLDGSMSQKQRASVLHTFNTSTKPLVLLLSLRAGGVGLNLTCANVVFMMDPWWSFAVEAQAIDRVHRMGQTQEVKVVRFVVEESIEEKMLRVQDRKKFLAGSLGMVGGMTEEERRKERLEDIRVLLS